MWREAAEQLLKGAPFDKVMRSNTPEGIRLEPIYRLEANPLPWLDAMLNGAEHTNFFENRSTEYSRAATQGAWDEVWAELDGA